VTTSEALNRAREKYLAGQHRVLGMLALPDLLHDSAGGDGQLAERALELLDLCCPGGTLGSFSIFADGGREVLKSDWTTGYEYSYDRAPAEVAAVMGRACAMARREEES
jgi:hypothetical protein